MFHIDGKKLRAYREAHHLSQRDLGIAAGMTANTIGQLERGGRTAHGSTVCALAKVMGINPYGLISDPDDEADRSFISL